MDISLIWPEKYKYASERTFALGKQIIDDLELDQIFSHFAFSHREYLLLSFIFENISFDPEVINYRLDVFEDLMEHPALCAAFREIMRDIENLDVKRNLSRENDNIVYALSARLTELQSYIRCIDVLDETFKKNGTGFKSEAFINLAKVVDEAAADEIFPILKKTLPELNARFRGIRSMAIGINIDKNMVPFEATLLSVGTEEYTGKKNGVLRGLLKNKINPNEGISQLHRVPRKVMRTTHGTMELDPRTHDHAVDPILVPLFKDLADIMKKTLTPIAGALRRFSSIRGKYLTDIYRSIVFYLHAVDMITKLRDAGLPVCRPEIRPLGEKACTAKDSYNINLALLLLRQGGEGKDLATKVVTNSIDFSRQDQVFIITGPNRGGKTTYLQSVGHIHILAQLGIYVPAAKAVISPVRHVFTHFQIEEKIADSSGRLGNEAMRFSSIFEEIDECSLCLCNESLSSTNAGESFFIAGDILRVFLRLGCKVVFSTHLHELAASVDEMNAEKQNVSRVVSLVSRVKESKSGIERTFKIEKGPPVGLSYAREIASKYGISFSQLMKQLGLKE
ncbi:MAG: hypothetical protein JW874_16420 [Spirochaetales bacterium]|nr:hypothetical protein [Spirochaetales bacterium]